MSLAACDNGMLYLLYFVAAALLNLGVPAGMRAGAQRNKQEKSKKGKPAESVLQVCALTLLV